VPKVSVIIPSYNHEKYISETIQSVLNQTYQDFEIIVIDDGSTDGTVNEIKKFNSRKIRLFEFDMNRGAAVAENKGIYESKGEYVSVLNSDDVFLPDKLEKQMAFLSSNMHIGAVFGYARSMDEDGHSLKGEYHNYFKQTNKTRFEWLNFFFYKGNCLCHPSVLIRKSCIGGTDWYDKRLAQLGDFDLWIRFLMEHEIYIIPEDLIGYRFRAGEANASGNRPDVRKRSLWERVHVLRNYLNIKDAGDLLKIFPEARRYIKDIDPDMIPFILANLALANDGSLAHINFALRTLFDQFKDSTIADKIFKRYNFSYSDLIRLTGKYDAYNLIKVNELSNDLKKVKKGYLAGLLKRFFRF